MKLTKLRVGFERKFPPKTYHTDQYTLEVLVDVNDDDLGIDSIEEYYNQIHSKVKGAVEKRIKKDKEEQDG